MEKKKRSSWATFLDTTPNAESMDFTILGIGVTDFGIAYNPNVDSEKWIIEDNARHDHTGNEKTGSVSQSIYEDDPCYKFVEAGRDELNYKTHILDIDMSKKDVDGSYYAELSDGLVAVTNFLGENATIEYDLYYEGKKQKGKASISDGKPTFIPEM